MTAMQTIGFIGAGNVAEALIKGLLAQGHPAGQIVLADPSAERQRVMREGFGVRVAADNRAVAAGCPLLVLAIKPQLAPAVLRAKVCSPGGTTLAGLPALEERDLRGTLIEAVARATRRSKELGKAT